jgi:hypothetical protein
MDDCRVRPTPEGDMKIICAGSSDDGLAFSAKWADYAFCLGKGVNTPKAFAPNNERLAVATAKTGRDVKMFVLVMLIMAETDEEAEAKWKSYNDGVDLDAATLHIGLSGLIEPSDPRFAATVVATEAQLRSGATVYRYRSDDGLPGTEGGFHLCAAWLVEAYLLTDQRSQAEALFDRLVTAAGPTGLLSEEYDPVAERALGNHPQAYSHLGLLRCAQLLGA